MNLTWVATKSSVRQAWESRGIGKLYDPENMERGMRGRKIQFQDYFVSALLERVWTYYSAMEDFIRMDRDKENINAVS